VRLATPATEVTELTAVLEIKGMLTDKAKARTAVGRRGEQLGQARFECEVSFLLDEHKKAA
jgi:hypothetical protein